MTGCVPRLANCLPCKPTQKNNLVAAINEAAASGGGSADWSQNDPDGDGYVANRPGGYDLIETRKILETTLVSADDDNSIIADANFSLAEGDSVHVSIGGAPEVTHKVSVTTSTGGGPAVFYSFGSKSYDEIAAGGFAATDYIVMWYDAGGKWVYMRAAGADLVGKTIVARADVATPVKIPGKYLEFVINATLDSSRQCALDKTFAQIREAVRAGNKPVVHFVMPDATGTAVMPLVEDYGVIFIFRVTISIDTGLETVIGQYIISINRDDKVLFATSSGLALNSDGNLPQQTMDRDPKQPMQIATKKYVDDHATGMGITGAAVGQIAKITAVDASGVPTAWSPADMPSGGTGGSGGETWELVAEATTTDVVNSMRVTFDACSAVYVEFCWGGVENDLGDIAIYPNTGDTPYAGEKRAAAAYVNSSASRKRGMLCVRMDCRVGTHWTAVSNQKCRADGAFGSINADNLMNMDIGVDPDVQYSVINSGYMTIRDDTPASGVKSITAYGAGMAIGTRIKVWGIKK